MDMEKSSSRKPGRKRKYLLIAPSTPKIPMKDYLGELIITREPGNDAIRAYGIRTLLQRRLNGMTLVNLSKNSGIKYKNILNWIGDSKYDVGIPMSELMQIASILGIDKKILFARIHYLGGTNTKKYTLPKCMSPKLAYLLGYLMGDGHLANPSDTISNGSEYNAEIRITTCDKHHLEYLQTIFRELFDYRPPLFKEKEFYRLVGRSKVIHRFLDKVCGVPVGNKKDSVLVPPIARSSPVFSNYFISGFFDADGGVFISKKKVMSIRIKQHSKQILEDCRCILKGQGFKSVGIYQANGVRNGTATIGHVLAIQNQEDIWHFINSFFSLKMQDRLVDL